MIKFGTKAKYVGPDTYHWVQVRYGTCLERAGDMVAGNEVVVVQTSFGKVMCAASVFSFVTFFWCNEEHLEVCQ